MTSARPASLRRRRLALALAGAGLPLGAGSQTRAPVAGDPVSLPPLADLAGQGVDGRPRAGEALVLFFFILDCGYCRRQHPRMQALAREVAGRPLSVIAVAEAASPAAVRRHLEELGVQDLRTVLDPAGRWRRQVSARRVTPLTVVIDREGRLREVIPGEMAEDDVRGLARWAA